MATMLSSLPSTTTVYRCASTRLGVAVTSWAASGDWVASYVTACCGADAKGACGRLVCRSCYAPLPVVMGGSVDVTGWESLAGGLGCPCPADCATTAMWKIEQSSSHG